MADGMDKGALLLAESQPVCPFCADDLAAGLKPRCAFPRGYFSPDNWHCKLAGYLREIAADSPKHAHSSDEFIALLKTTGGTLMVVAPMWSFPPVVAGVWFVGFDRAPVPAKLSQATAALRGPVEG